MQNKENILVVDDDKATVQLIDYQLKQLGYTVAAIAFSGEEALEKVPEISPDLVLMDIMLKGDIDGIEAADKIRNRFHIPVVFLSAFEDDELLQRAKIAEPFGYILKPFKKRDLHTAIEMALYKHNVEEKLRESERRYRRIIEEASTVVYITDPQGYFTYINPPGLKFIGYSKKELIGRHFSILIPREWKEKVQSFYRKQFQDRRAETIFEFPMITKSGETKWIEQTVTLLTEGNWILGFQSILHDITERKQAEKEIRQKTEDLVLINALNEAINQGKTLREVFLLLNKETKRIFSSRGTNVYLMDDKKENLYLQLMSLSAARVKQIEKIVGRKLPPLRIPLKPGSSYQKAFTSGKPQLLNQAEDIHKMMEEFIVAAAEPGTKTFNTIRRLIPQIYKVLNIKSVVNIPLISDGEAIGLMDISRTTPFTESDIQRLEILSKGLTAAIKRKQAEEALKKSKERYRALISDMYDGFVVTDEKDVFILVNLRMCEIFGCSREADLVGHSIYEYMEKDQQRIVREATKRRKKGISEIYEITIRRMDGKKAILRISASPILNENGQYIGSSAVITDLTDMKEREKLEASLYTISEAANSAENLVELYPAIHQIIKDLMPARNFYLALYEPEKQLITWPYFIDEFTPPEKVKTGKFRKGLTEYVLNQGESILLSREDYQDLSEKGEIERYGKEPVQWIGAPLKIEKETIGVLAVQTYSEKVTLTENHKRILEFVSTAIAQAINRKRTEEKREELVAELQEALENVKTLSGLVPICAWCKKIRDDQGYWQQVDAYIEKHSEAEFSHGICPECKERHFKKKTRKR